MDQRARTESPDVNPHKFGQTISNKGARTIQWGKDSLFNKWCWENWTYTCNGTNPELCLTSCAEVNSKCTKDPRKKTKDQSLPTGDLATISRKESCEKPRQHIKKERHLFTDQGPYSQSSGFPVVMHRCKSWTIKKAEHQRIDIFELRCWGETLENPLDSKEMKPVSPKGNQP